MLRGKSKSEYISLREAAKYCEYSQEYLSLRARQGKLKAIKFGRNWVTKREWLEEYIRKVKAQKEIKPSPQKDLPVGEGWPFGFPKIKLPQIDLSFITKYITLEPKRRFGFVVVLTLVLLMGSFVWGKESLQMVSVEIASRVREITKHFNEGMSVVIKNISSFTYDISSFTYQVATVSLPQFLEESFDSFQDFTANIGETFSEYLKWLISRPIAFFKGLSENYVALDQFLDEKIIERKEKFWQFITQSFRKLFVKKPSEIEMKEIKELWQEVERLKEEGIPAKEIVKEVQVSKVTRIEPVKEITREITKIDDKELAKLKERLSNVEEWESDISKLREITKKLQSRPAYTPAPTAPIYIASQGLQVGGNATFQSLGVSGMAGVKDLGVSDSAVIGSEPTDRLTVWAESYFYATATFGTSTLVIDTAGNLTTTGDITTTNGGNVSIAGNLTVTGTQSFFDGMTLNVNTSTPVLTIVQSGTGDLISLSKSGAGSFSIDSNGNITAIGTLTLNEPGGETWQMGVTAGKLEYSDGLTIASGGTGDLVLDSATGAIRAATGDTFYTEGGNPIREAGEEIFRASVSIYRYGIPAQTTSTSYVRISKHFDNTSDISLPPALTGTTRVYRLVINYADDIDQGSYSDWRIVDSSGNTVSDTFQLPGQTATTLEEGKPYLTDQVTIPDTDWQVEVKVPTGKTIRIFNIFLLAYDQVD